jgi:hypothetical protein
MIENDGEQFALEYEQARDSLHNFVLTTVKWTVCAVLCPFGLLIPLGPIQARLVFCVIIVCLTLLLFRYIQEIRSRWVAMDKARTRRQIYIAQRSQQTTIVAEPVHVSPY